MNGQQPTRADKEKRIKELMGIAPVASTTSSETDKESELRRRMGGFEGALYGAEEIGAPEILLHTGKQVPLSLETQPEVPSADHWSGLRKAEQVSPPPINYPDLSSRMTDPFALPQESNIPGLTPPEAREYEFRNQLPSWLNEQIEYVYRHPARTALEIGAGVAVPEAAAARWGMTVPGRMAVRATTGFLAGTAASLASETFDPSQKPLSHALTIGAATALGESFGELSATTANTLLGRGRRLEPGAREAFEQLERRGARAPGEKRTSTVVPSPGQLSKSPWADVIENVIDSTVFGHGDIEAMREAAQAAALFDFEELVARYVQREGAETVGGTLQEAIELSKNFYKRAGNTFYDVFFTLADAAKTQAEVTGKLAEGSGIRTAILRKAAERVQREGKRSDTAKKAAKWVLDEIEDKETISLREAHALRSDLRNMIPSPDEPLPGKAATYPTQLVSTINQEINRYVTQLGPDVARQFKIADTYWAALHEVYGDKFIKALLKAEPETVLRKVTPPEMPGTVRRIRNIILDPNLEGLERIEGQKLWEQVQGHVMLRIARQAEDADLEVIGQRGMRGLRKYWDETLAELFPDPKILAELKRNLTTLKITQAGVGQGVPGSIAVRLMQAGVLFDAPRNPGRVARVFVPVFLMKRVFSNEAFVRWGIIGSKAPPGSFTAARALTQMEAIVATEAKMAEREQAMIDSAKRSQRAKRAQGVTQ